MQHATTQSRLKTFLSSFPGILLVTCLGLGITAWFLFLQPTLDTTKQIHVVADFNQYRSELESYRVSKEQYPLQLGELDIFDEPLPQDRWGESLIYLSDGTFFVLVSPGKGGRADGDNYLALRLQELPRPRDAACRNPAVDQILTDRGWYRGCGK